MIRQLREALTSQLETRETLAWFRNNYLPEVLKRLNEDDSRMRMALYESERLRTNERNLTDTRTRLGLLIEHDFTRVSNEILADEEVDDLFWSYVVANRFPDLEVHRKKDGRTFMRIEMKALESRAEEKSANFATLVKDIDPRTDYLIVCLWQWDNTPSNTVAWDSAVRIERIYVFHAYSLAKIRDYYWLSKPPTKCKAYQGIDIRIAVNCNENGFSVEEHNMGKILRLWGNGTTDPPACFSELERDTLKSYLHFSDEVYDAGFKLLSSEILEAVGTTTVECHSLKSIDYLESGGVAVVPNSLEVSTKHERERIERDSGASIIVKMKGNYKCVAWQVRHAEKLDTKLFDDEKPKNVPGKLRDTGLV